MHFKAILEDQNPWWRDPAQRAARRVPIRRDLQPEVLGRLLDVEDRRAMVVLGPRQVGKTTLLEQTIDDLLDRGWPAQNLTYFDFSDDRVTQPVTAREVVEARPLGVRSDHPRILLLDEIRLAPNWARWLKQAVDRGRDRILVTDSAASVLREGGRESGQGRWDEYRLEGLSFREFLRLAAAPGESAEEALERLPNLLERYLAFGGFPEHVLSDDLPLARRRLRSDIVERAVLRDLADQVENVEPVRDLLVYLVQASGAIFNASGLGGELGRDERSIRRWASLLEDTFLIVSLPRRTKRASQGLRARPKLYAADHGLISAFGVSIQDDPAPRAQIFEAVVFRHLRATAREVGGELGYFRPKQDLEVDLVFDGPAGPVAVEVTSGRRIKTDKVQRLRRASEVLKAERTVLVHGSPFAEDVEGIRSLPLQQFLLDPIAAVMEDGR